VEDIPKRGSAAPAPRSRPKRFAWVAPCVLTALAFSTAGYFLGKSQRPTPAATKSKSLQPETPGPASQAGAAPANPAPLEPPPPPPEPEKLNADATLQAFLAAPNWTTRAKHVLAADEVRELMAKHAAEAGDGPIEATDVELTHVEGKDYIYTVHTTAFPKGFPVAVVETDEGPKVDWEAFVGFHDDSFQKLIAGAAGRSGIFHVLAKPEPVAPGDAESYYVRYRLAVPMSDEGHVAWIRKDSTSLPRMRPIFEGTGSVKKEEVDKMLKREGIPMVLSLLKKETNDGRTFLEIGEFIALGWGPRRE